MNSPLKTAVKKYLKEIGKRGGKSTSTEKINAAIVNLNTARKSRWPKTIISSGKKEKT